MHLQGMGVPGPTDSFDENPAGRASAPLLLGEDPRTSVPADARHWMDIYRRLLEFNEELLARMGPSLEGPAGRLDTDLGRLRAELERLRERTAYWERRYRELSVDLDIDAAGVLHGDGAAVPLSLRERQLLLCLARQPERYLTARALAAQAWRDPALTSEQVRTYIVRLRRHLERVRSQGRIESRRGQGYRFTWEAAASGGAQSELG